MVLNKGLDVIMGGLNFTSISECSEEDRMHK